MQGSNEDTNIENRLTDTAGGGCWRKERIGRRERVTWKHASPYAKQIADRNLLYDSGNSNRDSVTT